MKKGAVYKILRVAVVLGAAATIAWALEEFKPEPERRPPPDAGRLVEAVAVSPSPVTMTVEGYGTVKPRTTVNLVAEVRGRVVKEHPGFQEGGFIAKGDDLIVIDPRDYELDVESRKSQLRQTTAEIERLDQEERNLEATLRIARNDVTLSKNEAERLLSLSNSKVVSQSLVDQTEQKYLASLERLQNLENQKALFKPRRELLNAQRAMTQVMFRQAELTLERTAVRTPFDGWVLEKSVEVGQYVSPGQGVGVIYEAGMLEIEVRIPFKELKWLLGPFSPQSPLDAEVVFEDSVDTYRWPAKVIRQKAEFEATTRTLPLVVAVDSLSTPDQDPSLHLRPGMFVTVRITGRTIENAFVLPRHLVYPGDVVHTVASDRLHIRPVQVLRAYRNHVIIGGGLAEGDVIVATPLSAATEGMKVRIKNVQSLPKS
jgi:RND family efflux transporter MFP subunit